MSSQGGSVIFEGWSIWVRAIESGFAELCFDRKDDRGNKLDRATVGELNSAVRRVAAMDDLRGVLVSSAKEVFVVGADIKEFLQRFSMSEAEVALDTRGAGDAFSALEDLHVPTVAAINGYALGGGLELALACSLRVMSSTAQIGLPEVALGLIPGAGGHVRLPRVAGMAVAIEWISSGKRFDAGAAAASGVVDESCEPGQLRERALALLGLAAAGAVDWRKRRHTKGAPMFGDAATHQAILMQARDSLLHGTDECLAQLAAVNLIARCASLEREAALREELRTFAHIVKTPAAAELVNAFLSEQQMRRLARVPQPVSP